MKHRIPCRLPSRRAFSLVELLVVICIIIVLAVLTVPAFSNISRGSNLTTGGTRLVDQLELARQAAMTRNCPVEFRIYQLPKAGDPPNGSPAVYRAFQVFSLDADGTQTNALTRVTMLPDNVYIVPGVAVSSLLDTQQGTSPSLVTAPAKPLGDYPAGSYRYVAFRFKPNGGTDLNAAPAKSWHLSLALTGDAMGSLGVPDNFFTVQLNALTGRTRLFRP
ncbi:Verru_Chthon cassette protein D [Terrimicrobium sacchariphilum]|uniref:Verru_Chthon cassette protein D n=1 Tax=Terrimicrobium sacchariphilum TaxID=690879 RepID=A0A146G383_TERSA|nr:Verru_Chthon cassette protein D [Terrimicrobium sacchariphilum]GAT32295.1 Verru_Chthon cassette protein D [Terrimicrobium sacchariphilum]